MKNNISHVSRPLLFVAVLLLAGLVFPLSRSQAGRDDVFLNCGQASYADRVVSFRPGSPGPVSTGRDPQAALGPRDYDQTRDSGYVTLGCRGSIVLEFQRVEIVDIPGPDIHVFEIGPSVEPLRLEISRDGRDWIRVGEISGGRAQVDISGAARPGEAYRFVRLTDLGTGCGGDWPGADIDAVAALGCRTAGGPGSAPPTAAPPVTPRPVPVPSPMPAPVPGPGAGGSDLLVNGDFSSGTDGWRIAESGYGSSQAEVPLGALPPEVRGGCLRLGVFGGYQEFSQQIAVTGLDLTLTGRFMVEQWATAQGGVPGGWAALVLSFLDHRGRTLGSVYHYVNPNRTYRTKPLALWKKLGAGGAAPSGWFRVRADVRGLAGEMNLDPARVARLKIAGRIYGTHQERRQTIACFGGLALTGRGTAPPAPPIAAPQPGGIDIRLDRQTYAENQDIRVSLQGLPGNQKDWITIVAQGTPEDRYGQWLYTQGQTSGSWTFRGLAAGVYEVRVYFDWPKGGYQVQGRETFSVGPGQAPPTVPPPATTFPAPPETTLPVPPTPGPPSGAADCRAWIETGQGSQDLVGRNEEIWGDGVPDAEVVLSIQAPGRTITGIVVESVNGQQSAWDTLPGNGKWALAVQSDQGPMNRADGSLAYLLGGSPERLRLFLQDNGSISAGGTDYRVRVIFDDGGSCQAPCGQGAGPATTYPAPPTTYPPPPTTYPPPPTTYPPPPQTTVPGMVGAVDAWLGHWEVSGTTQGDCPGPGPGGSWPWAFQVFRSGSGYGVRQTEPEANSARIIQITSRVLRFTLDDPNQQEVFLLLRSGGRICTGSSFMHRPDRPNDPCAKSSQEAHKR